MCCVPRVAFRRQSKLSEPETRVGGPVSTHSVPLHPALVPPHPADQTYARVAALTISPPNLSMSARSMTPSKMLITLFVAWYNFCRVHRSLRIILATESGITDHIWTVAEPISQSGPRPPAVPTVAVRDSGNRSYLRRCKSVKGPPHLKIRGNRRTPCYKGQPKAER